MSDDERDGAMGELIDRRVQVYGNPVETFARIAEVWSGILGHHVNPVEVPLMMAGMKMVRAQVMPDYSDNSDDIDGYLDIFRQLVGEDMIHARTVSEFIEKKWPMHTAEGLPEEPDEEGYQPRSINEMRRDCTCAPRTLDPGCPVHGPIPYVPTPVTDMIVDGFDCIEAGIHKAGTRHTRAECPKVQP